MQRTLILGMFLALAGAVVLSGAVSGQDGKKDEAKEALAKAVKQGAKLFGDTKFGSSGKACATCHANPKRPKLHLKDRVGDYPKWDAREKKVITLGQKLNQMIRRMVRGKEEALGSERLVALEAYLMSIHRQ